jgi:hypothetical protein
MYCGCDNKEASRQTQTTPLERELRNWEGNKSKILRSVIIRQSAVRRQKWTEGKTAILHQPTT